VVNNPKDWPLTSEGVEVVAARAYLTLPEYGKIRNAKVFNLCRSYRYQATGYYVSLLAEARGHKALPSVATMQDLRSVTAVRFAADELEELIEKSLAPLQSQEFTLSIYFGHNIAKRYERLCARLFKMFPAPLMRAVFRREDNEWYLHNISAISMNDVPPDHQEYVLAFAKEYFAGKRMPSASGGATAGRYNLAILFDPIPDDSPSDSKAIAKFQKAAEKLDFSVEVISRDDYGRLAEFDALFIRETTAVNHYTYRFSRRAQAEGLVVIDDPESIVRCTNKVYLAECMARNGIPTPKTLVLHKDNLDQVGATVGFPCILKQPDSSFSLGVVKASNEEELMAQARRLMEKSDLIIAQEFVPTPFDWRVGLIDRQPLYVCKYHMSGKHWQIVERDDKGESTYGKVESIPLWQAPPKVVDLALKACSLIGDGLYGVDLKEVNGQPVVIEINDNPNLNAGYEDTELKEQLYMRVMEVFLKRVEKRKERRGPK
jgi:glutathione synthase/RimK-type ligase-like ATP-grasp enzyme